VGVAAIGLRTLELSDPARLAYDGDRPRPIRTHIWYPADGPPGRLEWSPLMRPANVVKNAPPAGGPRPAVMLSHGTGGSVWHLGWLAEGLVAEGYLVVGVEHHGNTAVDKYLPEGFTRVWDRPRDLSRVLDVLADDKLIDAGRVGVAGFSLGGYTALALLGARLDADRYRSMLEGRLDIEPPAEFPDLLDSLHARVDAAELAGWPEEAAAPVDDPRIRAAYALAPALSELVDEASLTAIDRPVTVRWGGADENAPPAENGQRVSELIPGADGRSVGERVGHFAFIAEATEAGRAELPELFVDPPGVDRGAVHAGVLADAVAFFNGRLRP